MMMRTHPTSRCWLLLVAWLLVGGLSSCQPGSADECRWSKDCGPDEFCRLGTCRALSSAIDTSEQEWSGTDTSRRSFSSGVDGQSSLRPADSQTGSNASACPGSRAPNADDLALNELLAHVPTGPGGDANGDGQRDPYDDEFVEIVNRSTDTLDLGDVRLVEGGEAVTTLEGVCLSAGEVLLVFGGIAGGGTPDVPGGARAIVSPDRFAFANSGSSFAIVRADGAELASFQWGDSPPESFTLSPQVDGETYRPHTELAPSAAMSPGSCPDGSPLAEGCPAPETDATARDVERAADTAP